MRLGQKGHSRRGLLAGTEKTISEGPQDMGAGSR